MKNNIILGIIFILFGLLFIFAPQSIFELIVLISGVIVLIISISKILVSLKEKNELSSYGIVTGIFGIIIGIILIIFKQKTVLTVAELVGVYLLISGISSLLFMLRVNMSSNMFIKPIIKIVIGIISFTMPFVPTMWAGILIGIILVLTGVTIINTKKEEEVIYKVRVKK